MNNLLTILAEKTNTGVTINSVGDEGIKKLDDSANGIINNAILILGIVAVVVIIIGGVTYMTSAGDASKVKKAKDTILYGIIGLVVVLLSYAIVNWVLTF